jgi:hypothetical protein
MKTRARRAKLPLNSPNWLPWGRAIDYVRQQAGSEFADPDLNAAIMRGGVGSKLEQFDRRTNQRKSTLLERRHFQHDLEIRDFWGRWTLFPRRSGVQLLSLYWTLYVWRPHLDDKIWPTTSISAGSPATTAEATAGRRPGTKYKDDWPLVMATKLVHHARYDPEPLGNINKLIDPMQKFVKEEIGWAPSDKKAVRHMIAFLLKLVRR